MKAKIKLISITVLVAGLLGYIIFAATHYSKQNAGQDCAGMAVSVVDSADIQFISREDIAEFIYNENINPTGKRMDSINLRSIEQRILEIPFVKRAESYKTLDGEVHIDIWQRKPLFRVISGRNQYYVYEKEENEITEDSLLFGKMPTVYRSRHGNNKENRLSKPYYTLIVTGIVRADFLPELYNFVSFLQNDRFWNAMVEQINVTEKKEIELVSKIGSPVIILGNLDTFAAKLEKLRTAYEKGLYRINWEQYVSINLKYKDQIVGVKKEKKEEQQVESRALEADSIRTEQPAGQDSVSVNER
jgi:cell division protein FtsQ